MVNIHIDLKRVCHDLFQGTTPFSWRPEMKETSVRKATTNVIFNTSTDMNAIRHQSMHTFAHRHTQMIQNIQSNKTD
jgi:hypothetical protein